MNILFTGFFFDKFHDSAMQIMEMGEFFIARGDTVDVVSVCISDSVRNVMEEKKITLHDAMSFKPTIKYDIVFSCDWPIFPFLLKQGLQYGKLVMACFSVDETIEAPLPFFDKACFIYVPSESLKRDLVDIYNIPENKIYVGERRLLSERMSVLLDKMAECPGSDSVSVEDNRLFLSYADSMVRGSHDLFYSFLKEQNNSNKNRSFSIGNELLREVKGELNKLKGIYRNVMRLLPWRRTHYQNKNDKIDQLLVDLDNQKFSNHHLIDLPVKLRLFAIIAVKNEERWLQGYFDHLRPYVDGFIVLDDGSTDQTPDIIRREKKLVSCLTNPPHGLDGWDEKGNRIRLMNEAIRLGANTVLCCDADERFEISFCMALREYAKYCLINKRLALGLKLCELWDTPAQWRSDGIWDDKKKFILFAVDEGIGFSQTMTQKHHIPWHHDKIRRLQLVDYRIYHLKMINADERKNRVSMFETLDPDHSMQKIGYQYLIDETGIVLESIDGHEYDMDTINDVMP